MFSFKIFLLFRVTVVGGKSDRKGRSFSKREVVLIVGFGFSEMWKNQQYSGGYVNCHNCSEKGYPSCQEKLRQLS